MAWLDMMPATLKYWFMAIRPKTLPAAVSPVLLASGIALGVGDLRWLAALAAAFCAVMIQIGTNLVNDVGDFEKGTDSENRLGPERVTQSGLLTPRQVWSGVAVSFGLAVLGGLYLIRIGGWPVLLIGVFSILAGIAYTVGPYALSDRGWGDLFALIFFGFIAVCGTVYVLTDRVPWLAWLGGLGAGSLTTAILVVNNIRDIETDRQAGRKNIPTSWGRQAGEIEFAIVLLLAYLVPLAALVFRLSSIWILLPLITLPWGIALWLEIRRTPLGSVFNKLLAKTAQLLLLYCILFAAGAALNSVS